MQSIFQHFSIPGINSGILCESGISSIECKSMWFYSNGVSIWIKNILNPLIGIKILGFSLLILVMILAISYNSKINNVKKTYVTMFLQKLHLHFNEIHPSIKTIKTKNLKGFLYNFQISQFLTYLFLTLATINLGGMVNGTWCITTWFSATIGLALFIWLFTLFTRVCNYIILFSKNVSLYEGEELLFLAGFFPGGTPLWLAPLMVLIEILSWIIRFLSMGLRIAGNLVAGHVILGILGFAYLELNKILITLSTNSILIIILCQLAYTTILYFECAVAIIQAYVFTLLASTFLKETEEIH